MINILLLLESQADSLGVLQELLRTLVDTSRLFAGQVGGGEVVDTVIETSRDQVGVKSHEILHLLLLNNLLKLLLFFDVQLIHVGVICIDIWVVKQERGTHCQKLFMLWWYAHAKAPTVISKQF